MDFSGNLQMRHSVWAPKTSSASRRAPVVGAGFTTRKDLPPAPISSKPSRAPSSSHNTTSPAFYETPPSAFSPRQSTYDTAATTRPDPCCPADSSPRTAGDTTTTTAASTPSAAGQAERCGLGRRAWLASAACLATGWATGGLGLPAGAAAPAVDLSTIQEEAYLAYAERRFGDAVNLLTECITSEPGAVRWREMRAEALVDGKNFSAAVGDFDTALEMAPGDDLVTRARLLSGRALAYEGLSSWEEALRDYRQAMDLAAEAGESLDPYVLNSIGNCLNSLGRWADAREQYLASAAVFQQARGFRGRNGSTTPRLDGAIFASSNAALMRAQMGDSEGAVVEMVRIARRAPGSADMRAALAALYWEQGRQREAEEMWEYACDRITVGCTKYSDLDWLGRIRRWPPAMVARMADFLALR